MRKIPCPHNDLARLFRHGDRAAAPGLLDFSVTVNPLGPPASVLRALQSGLATVGRYPDPDCRLLTERLAAYHGCLPSEVIVGNGANDLIYAITRAVRPRQVAIAEPTYTEYLRAALQVGATVSHWLAEGDDFQPAPFDPEAAELLWLCNPNNPTGRLWPSPVELSAWIAAHPQTLFVIDEAFLPLLVSDEDGPKRSMISWIGKLSNVVVLRSLTKQYALPGLRLGYAVAMAEWAQRIRAEVVPWSVNALAQLAGVAALADAEYHQRTRAWLANEVPSFMKCLAGISERLQPVPSATSFVLVRLKELTAAAVAAFLGRHGVAVREASNFVGLDGRYLRLAVRTAECNERLLKLLREILLAGAP
ncbi:MAG TPA: threonine-phosphate decarboxylase [Gemmataceae bacterium]|nr:threonine-phosphate decarboxylase [Gemmataceae bacterium]